MQIRFFVNFILHSFLDASLHLYKSVGPSVCPSVRMSVRPHIRMSIINYAKPLKIAQIAQKHCGCIHIHY